MRHFFLQRRTASFFLPVIPALALAFGAVPCLAADIFVNTTADEYNGNCLFSCSLRDAIGVSNANGESDTIHVPAGTYTLTIAGINEDAGQTGDLDLTSTDSVTIVGEGPGVTVIDGGGIDRVFHVNPGTGSVVFQGLTITGGLNPYTGGGIFNWDAAVVIISCEISGNEVTPSIIEDFGGGGIFNDHGTLWIMDSWIHDNVSSEYGGGIYSKAGSLLEVDRSTFSTNQAYIAGAVKTAGEAYFNNVTFFSDEGTNDIDEVWVVGGATQFTHCTLRGGFDFDNSTVIFCRAPNVIVTVRNTIIAGICNVYEDNIDAQRGNVEWGDTCFMGYGNYPDAQIYVGLQHFGYNGGGVPTIRLGDWGVAYNYVFTDTYLLDEDARSIERPVGPYGDSGAFEHVPDELFSHSFENRYATGWSEVVR